MIETTAQVELPHRILSGLIVAYFGSPQGSFCDPKGTFKSCLMGADQNTIQFIVSMGDFLYVQP